jgi:hypothetical protein
MATNLETYGDLKKLISNIKLKQRGEKIMSKGKEFALDQVLGLIPGASNAKTAFDFLKTAISKPDTKKTNTWLDKLDIDDDMSKIIDDAVENGFMESMAQSLESESDSKPLEDDFNMNQKLVDYLKEKYKGRTVTGITENNMKTQQLRYLVREEVKQILKEEAAPTIKGDTSTLIANLKKLDIPEFDASKLTTTISLVKQNKVLNVAANKVLADIMTAMIKTSDDALLTKIFSNLKTIEVA